MPYNVYIGLYPKVHFPDPGRTGPHEIRSSDRVMIEDLNSNFCPVFCQPKFAVSSAGARTYEFSSAGTASMLDVADTNKKVWLSVHEGKHFPQYSNFELDSHSHWHMWQLYIKQKQVPTAPTILSQLSFPHRAYSMGV